MIKYISIEATDYSGTKRIRIFKTIKNALMFIADRTTNPGTTRIIVRFPNTLPLDATTSRPSF